MAIQIEDAVDGQGSVVVGIALVAFALAAVPVFVLLFGWPQAGGALVMCGGMALFGLVILGQQRREYQVARPGSLRVPHLPLSPGQTVRFDLRRKVHRGDPSAALEATLMLQRSGHRHTWWPMLAHPLPAPDEVAYEGGELTASWTWEVPLELAPKEPGHYRWVLHVKMPVADRPGLDSHFVLTYPSPPRV